MNGLIFYAQVSIRLVWCAYRWYWTSGNSSNQANDINEPRLYTQFSVHICEARGSLSKGGGASTETACLRFYGSSSGDKLCGMSVDVLTALATIFEWSRATLMSGEPCGNRVVVVWYCRRSIIARGIQAMQEIPRPGRNVLFKSYSCWIGVALKRPLSFL